MRTSGLVVDGAIFPGVDSLKLYESDLSTVPARARLLEEQGWDGLFTLDSTVDPFLNLLLAAEHTERIDLITGVAIALARSPMTLAMQAWNLQEYSKGRLLLGLGSQVRPHIERRFSMPWHGPVKQMREYVLAMRAIWNSWQFGGELDFRGDHYTHTLSNPLFDPGPIEVPAPRIFLGALGPRMIDVAAEVADGIYGNPFNTPKFMSDVQQPRLHAALERFERRPEDFTMTSMLLTVTGDRDQTLAAAIKATRRLLAFYGSTPAYHPVLAAHGWGDVGTRLTSMSRMGQWQDMTALITDEMMAEFCVVGTPEEIPALVIDRCHGWCDRVTLYAPYPSPPDLWPPIVEAIQRASVATSPGSAGDPGLRVT